MLWIYLVSVLATYHFHIGCIRLCVHTKRCNIITHGNGSRVGRAIIGIYVSVHLFVCLCFPHNISKTDVARITKLDIDDLPWVLETHSFLSQKIKGQGHVAQKTSVSVFRGNAVLTFAAWFSHIISSWPMLLTTGFFVHGVFCSQPAQAESWHCWEWWLLLFHL